jgi:hypothetical protein
MQQGRADRASNAALAAASPELARVVQKGVAGDPTLTRDELTQWMMVCRALFLSGEDSFLQYKAGPLDRRAYDSYVAGARFWMSSTGMRAAWKLSAGQFGPEFRDFGNSLQHLRDIAKLPRAAYRSWYGSEHDDGRRDKRESSRPSRRISKWNYRGHLGSSDRTGLSRPAGH